MADLRYPVLSYIFTNLKQDSRPPTLNCLSKKTPQKSMWTQETGFNLDSDLQTQMYKPLCKEKPRAIILGEVGEAVV
jgi:hypothetical protein